MAPTTIRILVEIFFVKDIGFMREMGADPLPGKSIGSNISI
jgi:hypothetical protein